MRRLLTLVLMLAAARPAAAAGIRAYDVHVRVAADGTADVDAVLRLEAATGTLRIPAGFAEVSGLSLRAGPAGTSVVAEPSGKQTLMRIVLPASAPSSLTLSLAFHAGVVLSDGTGGTRAPRLLRHTLLNSQPDAIDAYLVRMVLPAGLRAHAVREALPARKPAETTPRVEFATVDGANTVVLHAAQVAQGEAVSAQVDTASTAPSPLWLIAGVSLSMLYLARFRDLVMPTSHSEPGVP